MLLKRCLLAVAAILCANVYAHAVTFNVAGTNLSGDTLSGTLESDSALTNVTAVNLSVLGAGLIPDGPLNILNGYTSPELVASGPLAVNVRVYLSFAGGPTLSEIEALILATYDPVICGINESCIGFVLAQQGAAFAAVATPAEVPLPAALPLFATVLAGGGLIVWRRKRKARAA